MRARTITLVEFDSIERMTLNRVEPSIRIGFPTDDIDTARLTGDKRRAEALKREWGGRWLLQVCRIKQEWDAKAIWGAWDAAVTLEAVLEAQADRAYWERELRPRVSRSDERAAAMAHGAVGLVAPGTDACGMLAESRGAQLRDLRDALPLLEAARDAVGDRPEPHTSIEYEGV